MTSFTLPLTVRTAEHDVDLLIDLPGPTPVSAALPDLISCAGLPAGTVLHLGVGPVEGSWVLGVAPLLAGCILSPSPTDALDESGPVNLSCVAGPDAGRWVAINGNPVVIGRDSGCDLSVDDAALSRRHARIRWSGAGLTITDLRSANGVRVDGLSRPRAGPSKVVPPGSLIRLGGSLFRATLDPEPALLLAADRAGHLVVSRPARVARSFHQPLGPPPLPAPERTRRPLPLLAALAGAIAGGGIAVITGYWSFLLLAAVGPVMMLVGGMSDRTSGRRSHRRAMADHRRAVAVDAGALEAAVGADRLDAWDRYPDPAALLRRAEAASTRLWERRWDDPDFLRLSLGVGRRPARVRRTDPPIADEVPITIDLTAIGVLGIAGDCRALVRQLLCQLVSLHSPADLQLSVFSDHADLTRARDLPHAASDGRVGVFPTANTAADEVGRLLSGSRRRVTVAVLDEAHRWRRTPRMTELLARAAGQAQADQGAGRLVVLCISASAEALPVECTVIAWADAGGVRITAADAVVEAELAGVSPAHLDRMICALAPLVDPDSAGAGLPRQVVWSSLLPPPGIAAWMDGRWTAPSLTAVLGVSAAGPLAVDLERDGPHALIAGTTGSGKSELLQTLITGLAASAPPDRTTFLLIDYKGGATFGRLAELPHTTGLVTDLDHPLAARALASLRAEVRRRERLLADAGAADMATLRGRPDGRAAPSLVIVVDEFATLAAELPEFLTGLLDIAQRGRSLGLHLVLATQRPAGVLSPAIKANIGLRICLRVTDDADSVDVIDTATAASLRADLPGRALLRRERSRTQEFQVATTSGAVPGGQRVRLRDVHPPPPGPAPGEPSGERGRSDLNEVVDAALLATTGLPRPEPPWLPPLPTMLEPTEPDLIALLDRPAEQSQVRWRGGSGSAMVLGPPASGRSSALRRFAWTAAAAGADLLVVDPGDGLSDLADWPGTHTHLDGQDPSLIQRLVQRLQLELRARAEGGGQPTAGMRSAGPPMLLLIDNWEAISGPLDELDFGSTAAGIGDLAGRGPGVGIRVVISGDLRLQHHRMNSAFTTVVRLAVDERGEASTAPPGRGRLGSEEIQCVRCPKGFPAPPTLPTAGRIPAAGGGRPPIVVRGLPSVVLGGGLPPARPGAIPIGRGGDDAAPLSVDLTGPGGGLLIAGPRRSGVSTTLTVLATGAAVAGITVVRGCLQPVAALPRVRDLNLRGGVADLRRLLAEHQGSILLVADDADSWPDDGADLLERFLTVAGTGQYLAIGSRLDRALRSRRGPVWEAAALRTGVLLHADSADGVLLDAIIPRRRGHLPAGRGHLIVTGRAAPLQVAQP